MTTKLIVFDLDGTIAVNPEFYRKVYSGTLESLIAERRGAKGLAVLKHCREYYDGKGELALLAFGIPFRDWARLLMNAPVDLIRPKPDLCNGIRNLRPLVKMVVYTGSPLLLATRILERLGFDTDTDFDLIVGWREPDAFPIKWACSSLVFEGILNRFFVAPSEAWAVGDNWETDLKPAQLSGMRTAGIRKRGGHPETRYSSLTKFLNSIKKEVNSG